MPKRPGLVLVDAGAGAVITAVYLSFGGLDGSDGTAVFSGPDWLGWLVAALVGLPLAVRRIWPGTVLAVVSAALIAATLLDLTREPFAATALALYTVGLLGPVRRTAVLLVLILLACGVAVYVGQAVVTADESPRGALPVVGLVWLLSSGSWACGVWMRRRRARAAETARQEREQERRDAQAQERHRIAREMHDLVSHNLSLIAVQAGVAHHVAEEHPLEARAALGAIETASRGALAEMRTMLGVLRQEAHGEPAERQPLPGLSGIPDLAARARLAGVAVELEVSPSGAPPPGVQLAAYRIVQEALTNVVKHAAPAGCTVRLMIGNDSLTVEVVDDGAGPATTGEGGHGLVGMRERVAAFGGELRTGPRRGGGFEVHARLPYPAEAGPGPADRAGR
jgi:signal transduction histidine kinase